MSGLDLGVVRALAETLGVDTFADIIGDYIEDSVRLIDEISAGAVSGDPAAVRRAAHELKSTARLVGASALADICAALELASAEEDPQRDAAEAKRLSAVANEGLRAELERMKR